MAANTFTAFPDFTNVPLGNSRYVTAGLLTGPTSYIRVTPGSPPTGGQTVSASQFGFRTLDVLLVMDDATGAYSAVWSAANPTVNGVATGILTWVHQTTPIDEAAASTNLSGVSLRVVAIGR